VIVRAHHLRDERLLDCYVAERAGETPDPPSAEHLVDCPACAARYAEFAQFMDTVRLEGELETDAIFTPERLRLQQQRIADRLQHVGQPAHVISFPTHVGRHFTAKAARVAPRWIAAAAAAGLFIGVGVGRLFESGATVGRFGSMHVPVVASTRTGPLVSTGADAIPVIEPATVTDSAAVDDEDVFLSELELALERPRTYELRPFDAFTPRVRDLVNRIK
jgi:hypothetical protein